MAADEPPEHEDLTGWRARADEELARLRALTPAQLGAEVLRRGFADASFERERTRIGLSNSLCPTAPPSVGGDDIDVVSRYGELIAPVLEALEGAGLVASATRGRSALEFYRVTLSGQTALEGGDVEEILQRLRR